MSFAFGSSKKKTSSTSSTDTNPWAPVVPQLQDWLGSLKSNTGTIGATPEQNNAFATLQQNANAGDPLAAEKAKYAASLYATPDRSGTLSDAYSTLQNNIGSIASGNADPMQNPEFRAMLTQVGNDAQNRNNAAFAAAGRSGSGMNQQAVSRGVTQAELPILVNQFNQMRTDKLGAANSLFGAGANTASGTGALDALRAQIQGMGQGADQAALDAKNYGANTTLDLQQQMKALPISDLAALANLLFPAAQLGGTSNTAGNSTTKGTSTSFGGNLLSDVRAKENIEPIGTMADGLPIYSYTYIGDPNTKHVGPMAQEVEARTPDAVSNDGPGGLKTVNMELATRRAREIMRGRGY